MQPQLCRGLGAEPQHSRSYAQFWGAGRHTTQLSSLPPACKEDRKGGKTQSHEVLCSSSPSPWPFPARVNSPSSMLQIREQKTATPQNRKQAGFLLPNKALAVQSCLRWIKFGTEIRRKTLFGRKEFCFVSAAWLWRDPLVWWRHIASPCS